MWVEIGEEFLEKGLSEVEAVKRAGSFNPFFEIAVNHSVTML